MQSPQKATTFWILTLVLSRAVMQSFGCLPSENSKKGEQGEAFENGEQCETCEWGENVKTVST